MDDKPVTVQELETAKIELLSALARIDRSLENHRAQTSAEHESQDSKLRYIKELTIWIKTQWQKFSRNDSPATPGKPHDRP